MKRSTIRIIVLSVSFVIALFVTSYFVNRQNAGMTAEMGTATLPTISFTANDREINPLVGYVEKMKPAAVRETVLPIEKDGKIVVNIEKYGQKISKMTYEVSSVDGSDRVDADRIDKVENTTTIQIKEFPEGETEGLLTICLELQSETQVYYYTRISKAKNLSFAECMKYVDSMHTNMLKNKDTASIEKVLESNSEGDNTTLQHVTIHSDLKHITWGDLKPNVIGNIDWLVQETKEAYTSVCLKYQVECTGDEEESDRYNVKEFFRVRHAKGKNYLLTYDRSLEEIFDGADSSLTGKGIHLGLTNAEMQYKANKKGTIAAFVKANELWSYNAKENAFALVFSFANSEKADSRHNHDAHSLKILSLEENGNTTFAVYGYMNRGKYEGKTGAVIYYFNLSQNVVEEIAFIPSNQSHVAIEKDLGKLAYYDDDTKSLFVVAAGQLNKIEVKTNKKEVVMDSLDNDRYVSSENGQMLGYQKSLTEAVVLNFATGSEQKITVKTGEVIKPLGFVRNDFVYGVMRENDRGVLSSGENAVGMYKMEIRDIENKVVKTYEIPGKYILGVKITGNMVALERAAFQNGVFTEITEDYITNNEDKNRSVLLEPYTTDLKETQYRLVFEDDIKDKKVKVLRPKQMLFERDTTIKYAMDRDNLKYSVYSCGALIGVYEEAGEAVNAAKETSGVVISPQQKYVWEDGNRVSWYRNFKINSFRIQPGESGIGSCIRAVLAYEGVTLDVMSELGNKTVAEILEEHSGGEGLQFKDCTVSSMRYLIDKGIPVVAITGSDTAILLVGYDAKTITYIDPSDGVARTRNFSVLDTMMSGSGNTFFAYRK